jgi:hypothetical protein
LKVRQKSPFTKRLVNSAYLDCLVNNSDRHGGNWEVVCDPKTKRVIRIAPLFDHAIALENGISDNISRIYWELPPKKYRDKLQTHYEIFSSLCEYDRARINSLLGKTQILMEHNDLNEFILPRFEKMKDIFEKTL